MKEREVGANIDVDRRHHLTGRHLSLTYRSRQATFPINVCMITIIFAMVIDMFDIFNQGGKYPQNFLGHDGMMAGGLEDSSVGQNPSITVDG